MANDSNAAPTKENPSLRKPHSWWAGYVAERKNTLTGDHNILVDCNKSDLGSPEGGGRWLILCNKHGTLFQDTSQQRLRDTGLQSGEDSVNWCDPCRCIGFRGGHTFGNLGRCISCNVEMSEEYADISEQ